MSMFLCGWLSRRLRTQAHHERDLKTAIHELELSRINTFLRKQSLDSDLQDTQTQLTELLATADTGAGNPAWEALKAHLEREIQRLTAISERAAMFRQDMERGLEIQIRNLKRRIEQLAQSEKLVDNGGPGLNMEPDGKVGAGGS